MPPIRQCVILAGGMATRLGEVAAQIPKPALDVCGRPFIGWVLEQMAGFGLIDFLLLAGHQADAMYAAAVRTAAALPYPINVACSVEPYRAGTGGALFHAKAHLDDNFLLCNGDSIFDCNLESAINAFQRDRPETTCRLIAREIEGNTRYGALKLEGDTVVGFEAAPKVRERKPAIVNAGIYLMRRCLAEESMPIHSLEYDLLPNLAAKRGLKASVETGWFIDIGVPDDLTRARDSVTMLRSRRATKPSPRS